MGIDSVRARRGLRRSRVRASLVLCISVIVTVLVATPVAKAAEPVLVAVEALSTHRLLATFDREPNGAALTASNYTITGPNGSTLAVLALSAVGNSQALVSTDPQQPVQYQITGPKTTSPPRTFTGSTDPEPTLLRAEAINATSVALTFSEAMGSSANEARHYQITEAGQQDGGETTVPDPATVPPAGGGDSGLFGALGGLAPGLPGLPAPLPGLPGLPGPLPGPLPGLPGLPGTPTPSLSGARPVTVTAAAVDAQDPARVILTTSEQGARDYVVNVGDILGQSGEYLDPTANSAQFGGLPPVDSTPPRLTSATPRDERTLVLTFDKPLHYSAEDASRYTSAPNLFIHSAALQNGLREVVLGTGVQFAVSYVVTADVVDAGDTAINPDARTATFKGSRAINSERPRIVSATSTGNTSVVVQFSKPMADNTVDPARWRVDQQSPAVGGVAVTGARFVDSERIAVELTTQSQGEVGYRASVADVTDLLGNPMAERSTAANGTVIDPTSANFMGTAPSGDSLVDSDGDGLYDHEETTSREVVVRLVTGEARKVQVTSDPHNTDTDGDGLDDFVEKSLGTDPRDADTDDDGLTDADEFNEIFSDPTIQDTDGDSLTDGLEVTFYNSSALLPDTDGDQLADGVETSLAKRNVRVADLPKPALEIGEMNLTLDVRFTENTATESKQIEARSEKATLMQSAKEEFANVTSRTLEAGGKFSEEAGYELEVKLGHEAGVTNKFSAKFTAEQSFNSTYLTSFTDTSTRETQSTFEESLDTTAERTAGSTLSREVQGAAITAGVVLESEGDIAFTIRNLQVTALMPHPADPARLTAIATLLPEAEPSEGYTLGPLVPERGPSPSAATRCSRASCRTSCATPAAWSSSSPTTTSPTSWAGTSRSRRRRSTTGRRRS